jgi:hypothetical protein
MTASIAHLKIKLDEVKPAVVRRVEVPLTIRLDRLHLVLQAAMGWTNSHLYEIRARDIGWGVPDPDFGDGPLDARKARLGECPGGRRGQVTQIPLRFRRRLGTQHPHRAHHRGGSRNCNPRLVEASGRCPPEDVGGPWGYRDFLEAIADPDHEQHAESVTWVGEEFDPAALDAERLANDLAALAKRWSRTPTPSRKRST